ncbi:tetratricopeptide repeat protein [Pseudoalteromonas sp. MMG010]|uniref:tetratricopeptide repeat protein n=1 Tax=Pseudoalteromonas sp. MMG010 TaxID=2822685 RepID=UPI001B3A1965|nr:tetratricopeptide repeat protein [Pseudoalteromonas sp. MMG010]MBQ4832363.1 tetratricopeptide repeat protein [Pseudoalteromonas sp. MMG010]
MNTKIYKSVHTLAESLMLAAQKKNQKQFDLLYSQLKKICVENDNTTKDHPVQWETLADFTDDYDEALTIYEIALNKAMAINNKDHLSSIAFAMAGLQIELGQKDKALKNLNDAKISANKIQDKELKTDIAALLSSIS